MYCSSSLHPNENNENISTSDIQEAFVRITRSQAKNALGGVLILPIKPSFKQVPLIELEFLANYLAELTLVEYTFLRVLPSLIAVHPWNPTLQHYTRYEVAELKNTVLALEDLQLNTSGCTLAATREKYNQPKFKSVAKLTSPKRVISFFSR